jgi:hypothetical protein
MAVVQRSGQLKIGVRKFGPSPQFIFHVAAGIGPFLGLKTDSVKYGDTIPLRHLGKPRKFLATGSTPLVLVVAAGVGDVRHPDTPAFNGENATQFQCLIARTGD